MPGDPFYKEHWKHIEPERMDRYERMFTWSSNADPLYEPAGIGPDQTIADFGCGPGHTAIEMARRVGARGHVHALDINTGFIEQTRRNAQAAGLADRVTAHQSDGTTLPLAAASLDRLVTRNTLIYVDDPVATVSEFHRIIKPDGKMHAIEGDWYMMVVHPVPRSLWSAFVEAAAHACRTPDIGRRLFDIAGQAGFAQRQIQVLSLPDTTGRLVPMIETMADYARLSGHLGDRDIDEVTDIVQRACTDGTYLTIAPQFIVTATKS